MLELRKAMLISIVCKLCRIGSCDSNAKYRVLHISYFVVPLLIRNENAISHKPFSATVNRRAADGVSYAIWTLAAAVFL